jgi:hypothetical protein
LVTNTVLQGARVVKVVPPMSNGRFTRDNILEYKEEEKKERNILQKNRHQRLTWKQHSGIPRVPVGACKQNEAVTLLYSISCLSF